MKNLCWVLFVAITTVSNAQQLLNSSFESWSIKNEYLEPDGWISTNAYAFFGAVETCYPTEEARTGQWAARLETRIDPVSKDTLKAVMVTGNDYEAPGTFYDHRPAAVSFYYKHNRRDTAAAVMYLTKWNTTFKRRDTVAAAFTIFFDSTSVYALRSMPLTYTSTQRPDSCLILFVSSLKVKPNPGNYLVIDDIRLTGFTGIEEIEKTSLIVYPNPASKEINIKLPAECDEKDITSITIWSLEGKLAGEYKNLIISTEHLPADAAYIVQVNLSNGTNVSGRFIKQ